MNPYWKRSAKSGLIGIAVGSVLTLPYFMWHSFWFLCIGLIVALCSFLFIVYSFFKDNDGWSISCIGLLTALILTVICFFWHDERYITPSGSKQHLYKECGTISKSKDVKLVTEAEGFFHLTFSDCKICLERKHQLHIIEKQERMREKQERMREERKELRTYLQGLIERLDTGENPDEIKHELVNDWSPEDDDDDDDDDDDGYVPGVPLRYQ